MRETEASTVELPPRLVFAGRVRPVVAFDPDPELEDPTVVRERLWLNGPDPDRRVTASLRVGLGAFMLLVVPAMLVVALAMAVAAR